MNLFAAAAAGMAGSIIQWPLLQYVHRTRGTLCVSQYSVKLDPLSRGEFRLILDLFWPVVGMTYGSRAVRIEH